MRAILLRGLAASVCLAAGCGETATPARQEAPIPYADPEPAGGAAEGKKGEIEGALSTGPFQRTFGKLSFSVPAGWREVPLAAGQTGFIDARFVIPAKDGTVEMTCLPSGGGIDANITRWVGQFTLAPGGRKNETVEVDDAKAQLVDLRGTFNAASSGKEGPHPSWRMLGVGIPLGERDFFLKLNGPEGAVNEIEESFREFLKSARIRRD